MGEVVRRVRVAWGITGGGDRIGEVLGVMKDLQREFAGLVEFHVFVSKAAETVLRYYKLDEDLRGSFGKVFVEENSNSPFLAAWLQLGRYGFFVVAPVSSNSVAKIACGIGDSLLTNSVIMALKAFVPVYLMPTDFRESVVFTKLPNGKEMKLRVRKEEADQVRKLEAMDGVHVLENPQKVREAFLAWLKTVQPQ